jgi:quinol monooxygenase YgiN
MSGTKRVTIIFRAILGAEIQVNPGLYRIDTQTTHESSGGCDLFRREESALMIIVRIKMNALPEKQKEVMQTLLSMIDTAGHEEGCLSYEGFCDLEDSYLFSVIEQWASREDLDRHIRSERFSALLGVRSLLAQPAGIFIHTVSRSEGEEVVRSLRGKGSLKRPLSIEEE